MFKKIQVRLKKKSGFEG